MTLRERNSIDMPDEASLSFAAPRSFSGRPLIEHPAAERAESVTRDVRHRLPPEGGRAMHRFPIQTAKVQRPPLPEGILRRERLLDWLDVKVHNRVVLVTAEAGYGKTTMLADWAERSRVRTLWYRLDEDDANWLTFVRYLVASGREAEAAFAPVTTALLDEATLGSAGRDAVVRSLVRELPTLVVSAPAALVLDDFHLVEESPDIQSLVRDVVQRLPDRMSIVLSSRRQPRIPLARFIAKGELAELTTDDLRFDVTETERLFRDAYKRPLEPEILAELSLRTVGWAASLQLVRTALRDRTPAETRSFVRNLSGTEGVLYDYLAEEVVANLSDDLQQFLMRTSILQHVDAELATLVTGLGTEATRALIDRAGRAGLLARGGRARRAPIRYHPLVRDFLRCRLAREVGEACVAALHRDVALAVEAGNWRLAAYHFSEIGARADLRRVVAAATPTILGTGEFELAGSYLNRATDATPDAVFDLFRSRIELHGGQMEAAVALARRGLAGAVGPEEAWTLTNLMSVEFFAGNPERSVELATVLRDMETSNELSAIAEAFLAVNRATIDLHIPRLVAMLQGLAETHRSQGWHRYYGITMLNLANAMRAMGHARDCLEYSEEALDALDSAGATVEASSASSCRAWALMHLGRTSEAEAVTAETVSAAHPLAQIESLQECGDILGLYVSPDRAHELFERARMLDTERFEHDPSPAQEVLVVATAQNLVRLDRLDEAAKLLQRASPGRVTFETAHQARILLAGAELATARSDANAERLAHEAVEAAAKQAAHLFHRLATCVLALNQPPADMNFALRAIAESEPIYLTMEADLVARRLGEFDERVAHAVASEANARPERWRPPLRRVLSVSHDRLAIRRAAAFLDVMGEGSDVSLLRSVARRSRSDPGQRALGIGLARRLAPRVEIEDLGRVTLQIGNARFPGSSIRRKSLALLCYLVTMPSLSATRDQVLDALWPEIEPASALNSLNQTVYFMRRVFEPDFAEDRSPGYIHHDSDVVWLDSELVSAQSIRCRDALGKLGPDPEVSAVRVLADMYSAPFAMDFMYEEWAARHRSALHAAFLEAVEKAVAIGLEQGRFDEAIAIARRALVVDHDADQIELLLLRLYRVTGAHAAAAEQYGHYAHYLRSELGIEVPPLESL